VKVALTQQEQNNEYRKNNTKGICRMKNIKVNFYVATGCQGSEREHIKIISIPDDYDCDKDPDQIIQGEYEAWMWENIDSCWTVIE